MYKTLFPGKLKRATYLDLPLFFLGRLLGTPQSMPSRSHLFPLDRYQSRTHRFAYLVQAGTSLGEDAGGHRHFILSREQFEQARILMPLGCGGRQPLPALCCSMMLYLYNRKRAQNWHNDARSDFCGGKTVLRMRERIYDGSEGFISCFRWENGKCSMTAQGDA